MVLGLLLSSCWRSVRRDARGAKHFPLFSAPGCDICARRGVPALWAEVVFRANFEAANHDGRVTPGDLTFIWAGLCQSRFTLLIGLRLVVRRDHVWADFWPIFLGNLCGFWKSIFLQFIEFPELIASRSVR